MCGIAGFFRKDGGYSQNETLWRQILSNMNRAQKHRGPDDEGIWLGERCGLAHVRLSIIDLYKGHQPMYKKYNGHECIIVYNGEIYNMKELTYQLAYTGVEFETESDTEVIAAGYLKYGEKFIKRLNGIFAFAIWDITYDRLLLVRDRLGVKPLFYTEKEGEIVFGSEIKALFEHPDIEPEADIETFQIILGLGPAKPCGSGIFKDIYEVKPGHYLDIDLSKVMDVTYWKLYSQPHEDSTEQTIEKVRWLIQDSVGKQMISDIPICTFLSGGIDSSLVTALCQKKLEETGKTLNTFSFDFDGNEKYFEANAFQPARDEKWVNIMKEYLKTEHRYLECDNDNLEEYLYKAVDGRDVPCMADVESSMMYFCEKVAGYNKVALTGECADEIFGGYPWFYRKELYDKDTFPWSVDMSMREKILSEDMKNKLCLDEYVSDMYHSSVKNTPLLRGEDAIEKRRREISYLNIRWFMANLLERMDRTSMHFGLEARVPFADHRIVEYLWNVPWKIKYIGNMEKGLLRIASKGILPDEVLYRKKSPYPKTYHPDYEKKLMKKVLCITDNPGARINTIINRRELLKWNDKMDDYASPWYGQLMAGPQMLAYILQLDYWLEKYKISI